MVTVVITWATQKDDAVCPICKAIDGYTWTFEGEVPDSLTHPTYGVIWDIVTGSLAHEHQLHKGSKYGLISNCRCHIEPRFDLKELLDKLTHLRDSIKSTSEGKV